jgi:hypothetical protein
MKCTIVRVTLEKEISYTYMTIIVLVQLHLVGKDGVILDEIVY